MILMELIAALEKHFEREKGQKMKNLISDSFKISKK
jgi:membrane protease subunit (stomatin/prohibitin family)